ncbi:M28 family peptidase [Paralimibaculum aggregatum]|uniref:M28 family peptidase n=1 Tax=Paralimibaculum aggregatum TaxID=3036245 RepID=A0ABQ6LL66_9RHOB|nr:M28 family peptidase [Limibaculum sp. NKW23]GMG81404.1 M28 family peptidase [Limibaculum sp. NKW23]
MIRHLLAAAWLGAALAPAALAGSPIGAPRQLTFEGARAGEGYFSADGRAMIFQSEREPGNPFYQIYRMDLETGDIRRLSPGHGKTTCGWLHPDGRRALFASTQADPAARAKMQAEREFRASGQTRRYAWDYDPAFDLTEFDMASGTYTALAPAEGYDAEGAYSPDGGRIVFASNRHAYAGTLAPEAAARLEHDPSYFMDLYVMNADGTGLRRLTDTPGYDGGPFWSADGSRITWRRFAPDGATAEVFTMAADGSDARQVTHLGAMSWAPFFHPSGEYIVFASNLEGFGNFELYLVDAAGRREPVRITEREGFDGLASFSPDGATIAWTSNATPARRSQIFLAPWDHAAARTALAAAPLRGGAEAAVPRPEMDTTDPAITEADLGRHLRALASEAMAGRLTGTPGEAMAADYVAAAFAALGLEGAGDGGGFTQSFGFTAGVALGPGNALEITAGGARLAPEIDRGWRPLAFSESGPAAAREAVFAGYGLVAPAGADQPAHDSYGEIDPSGKWVVIWRGLPGAVRPERRTWLARFADLRYRVAVAKSRGAAGVILAPPPRLSLDTALPRLAFEARSGRSGLPVLALARGPAEALQAGLAPGTAEAVDAGEPRPQALGGVEVAARIDLVREAHTGRNVLARLDLDGLPAGEGRPPVLIGAHLDHLGRGETSGSLARPEERNEIHYGADDNASGVAALIEIAQHLAAERASDRLQAARDVVFAAWSGEELGLLGSAHFVEAAQQAAGTESLADSVSAYVNLDMVGRLRDRLAVQGLGSSPVWAREIERRNAVVGLPVATAEDTYLPTDATSLYLAEVPILALFTGAHAEYHTPRDRVETINLAGLKDIARFAALVVRGRAMDAEEPAYVAVARPRGQGGRRSGGVFLGTIPDYTGGDRTGVPISGVVTGGPAAAAGLAGGDVILAIAGADLANIYDLVTALDGLKAGETVPIVVERGGRRLELEITPALRD